MGQSEEKNQAIFNNYGLLIFSPILPPVTYYFQLSGDGSIGDLVLHFIHQSDEVTSNFRQPSVFQLNMTNCEPKLMILVKVALNYIRSNLYDFHIHYP